MYADKEKQKQWLMKRKLTHPNEGKDGCRRYYQKHKKERLEYHKKYREENREKRLEYYKKYHEQNKEKIKEYKRLYRLNRGNELETLRRKTDINFRLKCCMRRRINNALHGVGKKSQRTMTLVGCTTEELKTHLQERFQQGMTWDNYGKWHIDHIVACAHFDLTDPVEQKQCFHYTNLQPLWAEENMSKGIK